jgi:hypothetical protein
MKRLIFVLFCMTITGCSSPIPNKQVITEISVCKQAGLDYKIVSGDFGPIRVECLHPK